MRRRARPTSAPILALALPALAAACAPSARDARAEATSSTEEPYVLAGSSAEILARLPDGEEKRRFLIDCTNCHTLDEARVTVDGRPRTAAEWRASIGKMLSFAGPETGFPILGVGREAGPTADWLVASLARPSDAPVRDVALPAGAEVREFELPEPGELPHDVAVLRDGRVLATGMFANVMWLLDPATGEWTTEPIPVAGANPRAIELAYPDPAGAPDWWVLLGNPHRVARRDGRTGAWKTWDVGVYGHSLQLDARGRAWFNSHFTKDPGLIGFVDPAADSVGRYDVPTPLDASRGGTPIPYGLRVASDGRVWGTELRGNRVVELDPATGAVRAWPMPRPVSAPRRPDFDAEGRLWIPEYAGNALTRFDPATESFTRYPLPLRDALPYVARVDRRRGRVWVGTATGDAVLAFDPATERFTVYPLPTHGALVRHIAIDEARGEVWLAYGASPGVGARVARVRP